MAVDAENLCPVRDDLPVFDSRPLQRITEQLHSSQPARRFATTYLDGLDTRIDRLTDALESGDTEQAMDAVLSLKVSSATVGAVELERMAGEVESQLRGAQTHVALRLARHLTGAAERARLALTAHLGL